MYSKTVISLTNLKEALLYFDYVIPLNTLAAMFESQGDDWSKGGFSHQNILPPALRDNPFFCLSSMTYDLMASMAAKGALSDPKFQGKARLQDLTRAFPALQTIPVDSPDTLVRHAESEAAAPEVELATTLVGLPVVDSNKVSWEQLRTFREDKETLRMMREFRLFAYENYEGKSRDYVEDDIMRKLDLYAEGVSRWGFETKGGAFTSLLSSDLVKGGLAVSFLSSLLNEPYHAIAAAAAGVGITLGAYAIKLGTQRFEFREIMRRNPVCYISHAREKLSDDL